MPLCSSALIDSIPNYSNRDITLFTCPLCATFIFSGTLVEDIPSTLRGSEEAITKVIHAIRLMQQVNYFPELYTDTVDKILK